MEKSRIFEEEFSALLTEPVPVKLELSETLEAVGYLGKLRGQYIQMLANGTFFSAIDLAGWMNLDSLENFALKHNLRETARQTREIIQVFIDKESSPVLILHEKLENLEKTLISEVSKRRLLHLQPYEQTHYDNRYPFGRGIAHKFGKEMAFDITEARRCLATGRSTACALHLMRVIDSTLTVLGAPLKVDTKTNPNWHSFLEKLHRALNSHYGTTGAEGWHKRNAFYMEIIPQVYVIKDAWRNPTFHAAAKYKPDQAQEIFDAVKAFVNRLADNMPITL